MIVNRKKIPTQKDIRRMEAKIQSLKAKAEHASMGVAESFKRQIKFADIYLDVVTIRLKSASMKMGDMGEELRFGIMDSWKQLQKTYDKASNIIS